MGYPRDKADRLYESPKWLLPPSGWVTKTAKHDRETGRILECLIEIEGAVFRNAGLLLQVSSGTLDKCSISLLAGNDQTRQRHAIYRLDINPTDGHANPGVGRMDLRHMSILRGVTHEHVYLDNLKDDGSLLDRCDVIARPIANPPSDLKEGIDYVRDRIHLLNSGAIPLPARQGQLL